MTPDLAFDLARAGAAAAVGLLLGRAYFASLRRQAQAYCAGTTARSLAVGAIARIGGAMLVFTLLAAGGATALLAALAGFLVARAAALRSARESA